MDINAGSWWDPEDIPGLAHFLEHMLFIGTKKYPGTYTTQTITLQAITI